MPAHYMGSLPRLGIWGLFRGSAGPQPPLLNRELFEAVQRRLTEQRSHHVTTRTKNDALLKGILFDAAGDPMVPTHATKRGRNSRYVSPRARWRLPHPAATAPGRSSRHHTCSAPGTGFFTAETKVRNRPSLFPENERLEGRIGKARRSWAFSARLHMSAENLNAWWGWEDSNLQPDRYERTSPAPQKRMTSPPILDWTSNPRRACMRNRQDC